MTQSSHQVDDGAPAPSEHRSRGRRTTLVVVASVASVIKEVVASAISAASAAANRAASCTSRSKSGLASFMAFQHNCFATAKALRSCSADANSSRKK